MSDYASQLNEYREQAKFRYKSDKFHEAVNGSSRKKTACCYWSMCWIASAAIFFALLVILLLYWQLPLALHAEGARTAESSLSFEQ
mmetsp:Transcript_53848/g.99530  ORF Transcript_53848/g.99530 Transcript_53848/m.99530 type:complete len:86 (-) Transcript_53848:22-279(-)